MVHTPSIRRRAVAALALLLALLSMVQTLPGQFDYLRAEWDGIRLWPDTAAQTRRLLGTQLYDMLMAADAVLPKGATVLLVTPGLEPRSSEYVAFHRALYHLAPVPVWWVNPARPDDTWESRWWVQAPITSRELAARAQDWESAFGIFYQVSPPPGLGTPVSLTENAYVVALDGEQLNPLVPRAGAARNEYWRLARLVVGLLVIFAAGYLFVGITARLRYGVGWFESAALAWAIGAGAVSLGMLSLNAVGLSLDAQIVVVTVLTTLATLITVTLRKRQIRVPNAIYLSPRGGEPDAVGTSAGRLWSRFAQSLMAILIAGEIAYVALLALGRPLSIWDSWVTWAMKARIIFLDGHISAGVFADPSRTVTHLDYPLLMPLVEAWTFAWAGTSDDWLTGIQAVLFFASLLGVSYGVLRQLGAGRMMALAIAGWTGSMANVGGLAALVFADVPLAVYSTIAGAYVVAWLKTRSPGTLMLACIAGGFMPWVKREGMVLFAALVLSILILNRRHGAAWTATGGLILAALLLSGPWWAFVHAQAVANTDFMPVNVETFLANLSRLPAIARIELASLFSANWNYVWIVALVFGGLVATRPRQIVDLLPLTALLYLSLMSIAYIFSAFVPFQQHVASSVDRLIAHVVPLPVLWIASREIRDG